MGFWKGTGKVLVWAFARETEFGRKFLGRETLAEQWVRERRLGQIARVAYEKSLAQQGRDLQYEDDDCVVRVKMGYSRDHHCYTTDIIIAPRDHSGDRYHVIIDGNGNELYSGYHPR